MKSIIDELDILLKRVNESNDTQDDNDRVVKDIPVYDEMKTKEQGINKALEKLAKSLYISSVVNKIYSFYYFLEYRYEKIHADI